MRLYVVSDLHLEFPDAEPLARPTAFDYDVLVLAGDIDLGTRGFEHFVGWNDKPVLYLAGTHEFYGEVLPALLQAFRDLGPAAGKRRAFFLERDEVVVDGVRFLGTTLWTDFRLYGDDSREAAIVTAASCMNDYLRIGIAPANEGWGFVPLGPADTASLFEQSVDWLEQRLAAPSEVPTVVITHHLPAWESVPERARGDLLSSAYASDLSWLIERYQPALWIHGHMHAACDYMIGATRVVCNPRGYPGQKGTGFRPDFVVEV